MAGGKRGREGVLTPNSGRSTRSKPDAGSSSVEQLTLPVGNETAVAAHVSTELEGFMCHFCASYSGSHMSRQVCSRQGCKALLWFCSSHVVPNAFSGTVCMICHTGGAHVVEDAAVTRLMRSCILLPCKTRDARCTQRVTAAEMEDHLKNFCMFNVTRCPKPGCTKR